MWIKVYFYDNPTLSDLWNWLHYTASSFDQCENTKNLNDYSILEEISSVNNDSEWFRDSDETVNKSYMLEFVSFVAFLSNNLNEPVYFIKVEEKGIAECELRDRFGHVVLVDEPYIKENYLRKIRSRNISKFQFHFNYFWYTCV